MRKKKKVTGKLYSRPSHKKQKEDPIGSDFAQWNSERSSLEKNCDVLQALNRKRIIRSQDYNRNLLKYLNNDRQRHASFCDLVVIVEGKEFNVHKVVVAVGSSYFHACLSKNPQADIVNLDHVSSLVFQHLLEFLYTSEFLILENEITSVLEAARFLDIIDAVKLLTTETDFSTTGIQPLLDVAHESITKLESSHKCLLCQRTFCYKKTLENHMGKVHGFGKTDIVSEDFDSPTRKSMRKRKCPVKFENGKEQGNDLSIEACKSSQYRMDSEESLNEEVQGVEESGQEGEGVEESGQEGEGVEESSQEGEGVGESSQEGEGVEESSQENKGFEKSSQEGEGVEESRQGGEGVEERSQGAEGEKEISQGKKREEEISQREEKKEDSVQGEEGEEMDQGGEGEEEESEHEEEGEEEMSQRGEGEEEESEQEEEGEEEMGQGEEGEEESGQVEEGEEKELCFEDMEQSDGGLDEAEEANENLDTVGSYPDGFSPIVLQKSSKKILKCPKCEKVFDRMGKYESHIRVHTGEKPFECDICHQRYSTKSNLTVHKKRHNSETEVHMKEHKCPSCGKLHASKNTLGKHVKRFHPENAQEFVTDKRLKSEGWKCDICNKSFTRRPHLQEHMILHSQDKPFKCTYCEEHFKSRFPRLKHQEKYHLGLGSRDSRISSEEALRIELESPFPCDICGRQFNDTGNLKRHIEYTHGGKRKWTCFICGKSVRERTTLKEHLRIHSGEKPHLCSICGQNFRHGSSYRLHLRVHHDDKRYECNDCGKSFIRHDHLTKHRKIHSGEKEHQCEECGKCFGRRDHLTVHYKSVHLGEKVWQKYKATFHQCEVCKKVFKGKSSLDMHFRTHSGEKPYKCHICNQSFRIKKTLTKHLVIHSDARPFNCQYCNASFKRKDKLKYHIDHVHGSKAAEDGEEESREDPNNYPAPSQSVDANICMPLTLVPVEIAESEAELEQHPDTVLPTSAEYQRPTDLTFLEKYTLTPQPVTLLHPVRPEQIMESREHSYLGTLLGLDPPPPVQNIDTSNHH